MPANSEPEDRFSHQASRPAADAPEGNRCPDDLRGPDIPDDDDGSVLLHESSADGNVQAVVEQDDRTAYFYLHSPLPGFGTRACWVRNLVTGPVALDRTEMQEGLAPRLPRLSCRHPQGAAPLRADDLEIVWFETGDGAALFEKGEMIAAIPPWSGEAGFHGYARDCREECELCWPMPLEPSWLERVERARAWWRRWQDTPVWPQRQDRLLAAYEGTFGEHHKYFSIDGQRWPPRGLASFAVASADQPGNAGIESSQVELLLTIGVSLRPMPQADPTGTATVSDDRIEFGAWSADEQSRRAVATWISRVANYPWYHRTWIGDGHTMVLPEPEGAVENETAADRQLNVLWLDHRRFPAPLSKLELPPVDDVPTRLLLALPLTAAETAAVRSGSAEALVAQRLRTPESWPLRM